MGENIKELLNEEIAAEIQAISSLDSGSEKKSKPKLEDFMNIPEDADEEIPFN